MQSPCPSILVTSLLRAMLPVTAVFIYEDAVFNFILTAVFRWCVPTTRWACTCFSQTQRTGDSTADFLYQKNSCSHTWEAYCITATTFGCQDEEEEEARGVFTTQIANQEVQTLEPHRVCGITEIFCSPPPLCYPRRLAQRRLVPGISLRGAMNFQRYFPWHFKSWARISWDRNYSVSTRQYKSHQTSLA